MLSMNSIVFITAPPCPIYVDVPIEGRGKKPVALKLQVQEQKRTAAKIW
jgi:hypothetical protein